MSEKGIAAVRARYGPEMAERILRWPEATRKWALAHGVDEETTYGMVERAEKALVRAKHDPDFALNSAQAILRSGTGDHGITEVGTVVAELGRKDEEGRRSLRAWGKERAEELRRIRRGKEEADAEADGGEEASRDPGEG